MAQGLFTVGFTVAEVLRIQAKAKEMLMEGKTLMSWGDSGSNASKQFPMTVKENDQFHTTQRIFAPSKVHLGQLEIESGAHESSKVLMLPKRSRKVNL